MSPSYRSLTQVSVRKCFLADLLQFASTFRFRYLSLLICTTFILTISFCSICVLLPDAKPKGIAPPPARSPAPAASTPAVPQQKSENTAPAPAAAPAATESSAPPAAKASASTEPTICSKCKKDLDGTYMQALDKFWHPDCLACSKCTSPLEGNFYEHETGVICQNCASNMFKCAECGQSIAGSHLVFDDGRIVHPTCVKV